MGRCNHRELFSAYSREQARGIGTTYFYKRVVSDLRHARNQLTRSCSQGRDRSVPADVERHVATIAERAESGKALDARLAALRHVERCPSTAESRTAWTGQLRDTRFFVKIIH